MAMKLRIDYRQDPGHGWLVVNHLHLQAVGLKPTDFSAYSYRTEGKYALEEDCDAALFMNAARERGVEVEVIEHHTNNRSAIRNWRSILS